MGYREGPAPGEPMDGGWPDLRGLPRHHLPAVLRARRGREGCERNLHEDQREDHGGEEDNAEVSAPGRNSFHTPPKCSITCNLVIYTLYVFSTFSHALVLASHCFCSMPMIMCEYAHAMGSAYGSGCADFERAFRLLEFRRCLLATFGPVSKLPFDHFPICLFSSRSQTRPKHKPVHRWFILALEYLVGCTAPFCILNSFLF